MGVEIAENIVQHSGVSRSTLLFCLIDHGRSRAFPPANGLVENGVKIAKKILCQASPVVALLSYRATPSSTGVSPAQALIGRQLKTKLPVLPSNAMPEPCSDEDLLKTDQKRKDSYEL